VPVPKRKMKIQVPIDDYPEPKKNPRAPRGSRPGMNWRRNLYRAIIGEAGRKRIQFEGEDLEVDVILYGTEGQVRRQDVDNLAKHVLDALQGRLGGPKAATHRPHLVPNDAQFKRLTIEKRPRTTNKQHSKITVRDYVQMARVRAGQKKSDVWPRATNRHRHSHDHGPLGGPVRLGGVRAADPRRGGLSRVCGDQIPRGSSSGPRGWS
jgi:Holliday junction resolvase RusA-like endonuclease